MNLRRIGVVGMTAGLMWAVPASGGFACGYHDPQSVSRGFLNWIYPDSLHVMGAISEEMAARRLPLPNFGQNRADLFGREYRATQTALKQFGEMLRAAPSSVSQPPVSLVLVEPMLWTRFKLSPQGIQTSVHVSGAERGDLVLVSGESVIGEIAARRLTVGQATERGLMRLYGPAPQIAQFLIYQKDVGENASVDKALSNTAPPQDRPDSSLPAEVARTNYHTKILIHQGGKL